MSGILNSFIKKLINKPYQYEVIIYFGNLNVYKFFTAKNVSSNFSQELETVHSFGSLEPKDIYAKKRLFFFNRVTKWRTSTFTNSCTFRIFNK